MKVVTWFGTRPEIIRLSRVIPALDAHCTQRLVHTGQNYDESLSDVFFRDLGVRAPDVHLGITLWLLLIAYLLFAGRGRNDEARDAA